MKWARKENPMPGRGNIRKLTSGRYQVRFTDQNGQRRSFGTFESKKAATDALRLALTQVEFETYQPEKARQLKAGKSITLAQAAERYRELGTRGGKPLSPRTLFEYQCYISRDLGHLAKKPIAAITQEDVEAWWIKVGEKGTLTLRSKVYSHLKSITRFALRKGWISADPCQIRGGGQAPSPMSVNIPSVLQVRIMIDTAPLELKALFAIAAWGGLRKGEILELRRKDVLYVNNESSQLALIRVQRAVIWLKDGQTQVRPPKWDSARDVLLPSQASKLVAELLDRSPQDPDALLFPARPTRFLEHLGNHRLNRVWYKVRSSSEYSGTFHSLRSFAGTQFVVAGATLRETMSRLGHSSAKTAMRYQASLGREEQLVRGLF
jgi:integrase